MTLYTKAGSVILMRDAVAIDKASPQPRIPFRSTALAIAKSSDGLIRATGGVDKPNPN